MEPTESELAQEEAEVAAEIAARERRQAAKQDAAKPAQSEIAPQDIIFEDGKAIISPYVHVEMPVSTMRLTFQGGETLDIPSNLEFVGLDKPSLHTDGRGLVQPSRWRPTLPTPHHRS